MAGSPEGGKGEPARLSISVSADPMSLRFAFLPAVPVGRSAAGRRRSARRTWVERAVSRRFEQCRVQVLRVVDELAALDPADRVPRLLPLAGDLLRADMCCFHEVDLASGRRQVLRWPDAGAAACLPGTPLQPALLQPALLQPGRLQPAQSTPASYRDLFAPLPTQHQLAVPVRLNRTLAAGCAAGRHLLPFTDHEHQLAGALQLALTPLGLSLPKATAAPAPAGGLLTPREHQILLHLATGLTATAIGRALAISQRTVHKHLEHLYYKLGVNDRLSAVSQAQAMGLLPLPTRRTSALPAAPTHDLPPSTATAAAKAAAKAAATPAAHRELSHPPPPRIIPAAGT